MVHLTLDLDWGWADIQSFIIAVRGERHVYTVYNFFLKSGYSTPAIMNIIVWWDHDRVVDHLSCIKQHDSRYR
jgi:hypothetical protein